MLLPCLPCMHIQLLLYTKLTSVFVTSWTYTYSNMTMTWKEANAWCQKNNSFLMAVKNREEHNYLKNYLPHKKGHYWIGLEWRNGSWTWQRTAKPLESKGYWAPNEPNNKTTDELCVEMYSGENNKGLYNDDNCSKTKTALCYRESCTENSCNKQGKCVEIPGNYTCQCNTSFTGPHCEEASPCKKLIVPDGEVTCSEGNTTICMVQCFPSHLLLGTHEYSCRPDGSWSNFQPLCASYLHLLIASSGCAVLSTICCCAFCCSYCWKRKSTVKQRTIEEVMNPVYAGDALLEAPLSSV